MEIIRKMQQNELLAINKARELRKELKVEQYLGFPAKIFIERLKKIKGLNIDVDFSQFESNSYINNLIESDCAHDNISPCDVNGIIIRKAQKYKIFINIGKADVRQKFSLAHEIGHIILNHIGEDDFAYRLDYNKNNCDDIEKEIAANAFAGELLMPTEQVNLLIDIMTVKEMASSFGVSQEAMRRKIGSIRR